LQYIGVILAIACAIWAFLARKQDARRGIFRIILATLFAAIAACSFLFLHVGNASIPVLLVGIPAAAGLTMIYYLYQREFFFVAIMAGLGILGLWVYRADSSRYPNLFYVYITVSLCILLILTLFTMKIKKQEGNFIWREQVLSILKPEANYATIWATCILVAASFLITLALGAVFAYYALIVLVIWIFIMAVYFTSRLM